MNERLRHPQEGTGGQRVVPGGDLEATRETAGRMLAAGAEAIRRALSTDSEAFLNATRQQSGQ